MVDSKTDADTDLRVTLVAPKEPLAWAIGTMDDGVFTQRVARRARARRQGRGRAARSRGRATATSALRVASWETTAASTDEALEEVTS